jgi:hypothetical protein
MMTRPIPTLAIAVFPNLKTSFKDKSLPLHVTLEARPFTGSSTEVKSIEVKITSRVSHHRETQSGLYELVGEHEGRPILIKWYSEYVNACFLYYTDPPVKRP